MLSELSEDGEALREGVCDEESERVTEREREEYKPNRNDASVVDRCGCSFRTLPPHTLPLHPVCCLSSNQQRIGALLVGHSGCLRVSRTGGGGGRSVCESGEWDERREDSFNTRQHNVSDVELHTPDTSKRVRRGGEWSRLNALRERHRCISRLVRRLCGIVCTLLLELQEVSLLDESSVLPFDEKK